MSVFNPGSGFMDSYDYSVASMEEVRLTLDEFKESVRKEAHLLEKKTLYLMSEPYQPKTASYTRALLVSLCNVYPRKVVIQTRSPLVMGDMDIMRSLPSVRINFIIETDSEDISKAFMPTAPKLSRRWATLSMVAREGIPVCITATPTLPFSKSKEAVEQWCESANSVSTLTHVVVQPFHEDSSEEYDWFFRGNGYKYLKEHMKTFLRVPLMEGKSGFAPDAPNEGKSNVHSKKAYAQKTLY